MVQEKKHATETWYLSLAYPIVATLGWPCTSSGFPVQHCIVVCGVKSFSPVILYNMIDQIDGFVF